MPLEKAKVNLWKSGEVPYLQTDSYSTGLGLSALCTARKLSPIWRFRRISC